jgi:N-acetylmuramoyl-L-alanine amidase
MPRKLYLLVFLIFVALVLQGPACGEQNEPNAKNQVSGVPVKKATRKPAKKSRKALHAKRKSRTSTSSPKTVNVVQQKKEMPEKSDTSGVPAIVKELRHWSNPDYTRIAITLDREARFAFHRLPQNREKNIPPRLYIDIENAKIAPGVNDIHIGDGLLKTARIGQYRPDTVRVVLDLDSMKDYKIFTFSEPFRIIIDARGERQTEISRGKEASISPLPATPAITPPPLEEKAKGRVRSGIGKIRRIVVDPGHGGHDPGAQGVGGTREKDVVLQIALRLAHRLKDELGLDVVLTRSTDVFLELQERTAIANKVGADLFVSIHANASLNRNSSGIETYYLNLAKTEKVAQLAAKENGTSLEKVSLLQAVLFDLMANYKLNDSAQLADEVQKAVYHKVSARYTGVKNLGVKQGPFYVLVGATMPSILVETAFVSNVREEARLNDTDYQECTAEGIFDGIREYIVSLK